MRQMKPNWEYEKAPDPSNWHQAVEILKQKEKPNRLLERIPPIEELLKPRHGS